jgi:hypothetical protein
MGEDCEYDYRKYKPTVHVVGGELDPEFYVSFSITETHNVLVRPSNQLELCTKDHRAMARQADSDYDSCSDMGFESGGAVRRIF